MASTTLPLPAPAHTARIQADRWYLRNAALCAALTPIAILVHGYHPYAEDGGIYLAGIRYLIHPQLYPYATGFITAHLHFSVFARIIASLTQATSIPLMGVMLLTHAVSLFLTLFAAACVARQLFHDEPSQRAAITLLAASLTVPVAGTSLVLMDPYVTARSLAMPCVLFAIAALLQALRLRGQQANPTAALATTAAAIAAACILHPLSGGYGLAFLLLLATCAIQRTAARRRLLAAQLAAATILCVVLNHGTPAPPAGYSIIAQTRAYWFLAHWQWYEWIGWIAPVLIFLWFGFAAVPFLYDTWRSATRLIAQAAAIGGCAAVATSLAFAHSSGSTYAVAHLQPMRLFHIVYVLLVLYLGATLRSALANRTPRYAITATVAVALFLFQRNIYAHSAHLELPWRTAQNPWQQAFLWTRDHTAINDLVALDANYISAPAEDAQNFRAIAERSMLADSSKDGGIAAIQPALTRDWLTGTQLQQDLNQDATPQRLAQLRNAGARWIILPATTTTQLTCPYRDNTVAVCNIPAR